MQEKIENNDIEDADFEEIPVALDEADAFEALNEAHDAADEPEQQQTVFTSRQMLALLKGALEAGHLSKKEFVRMRSEMGIFQSNYTRNRTTDAQRKAKRKSQKQARKKQRRK